MTTIRDAVKAALRQKLPRGANSYHPRDSLLDLYAQKIIDADLHSKKRFEVSSDSHLIKGALEDLRRLESKLLQFEYSTRLEIAMSLSKTRPTDGNALDEARAEIQRLVRALEEEFSQKRHRRKANTRANYQAASVAAALRKIWAWHEMELNREKYGPTPSNFLKFLTLDNNEQLIWLCQRGEYEVFLRNFAPPTQNHTSPGPFGRCLEEVFETLGILSASGGPVAAATALDALANFECPE